MERVMEPPVARHHRPAEPRTVRVAIAGCGAVGSALVHELRVRRSSLADRHGARIDVCAVLVRDVERRREVRLTPGTLDADLERFLAVEADVLVEAIGGIEPARRIVESAIRRGITVITANKALLAAHGPSLVALAERHGAVLRYDAAVGGGVPVLRLIDDALGAGLPRRVTGILNGTTNFVLTGLERGEPLDDVLASARRRGFAEADSSRDLDGRDAADKIAIVAWAAYGVAPADLVVRRTSLLPDPARYSALASRLGCAVRQVAECALVEGQVVANVAPVLVPRDGAFAGTRDEQNRVEVHTGWTAPLCASGPGAGGLPTATALLSDLLCTRGAPVRREGTRVAAVDTRRFAWAVEARCTPIALHQLTSGARVVRTNSTADTCWVLIEDATAPEVEALLRALEERGASPIAARFSDDDRGGGA